MICPSKISVVMWSCVCQVTLAAIIEMPEKKIKLRCIISANVPVLHQVFKLIRTHYQCYQGCDRTIPFPSVTHKGGSFTPTNFVGLLAGVKKKNGILYFLTI